MDCQPDPLSHYSAAGDTAWICCRSTWTRVSLPIKSSKTQTRASLAICSTVAMKLANGPECIFTDWPASKFSRGTTLPTLSHRAQASYERFWHRLGALGKAEHARYAVG